MMKTAKNHQKAAVLDTRCSNQFQFKTGPALQPGLQLARVKASKSKQSV